MQEKIGEIIGYTLFGIFLLLKPHILEWFKRKKRNLAKSSEVITKGDNLCYYLQGDLKATRVNVWQFGNGDESFLGFSFKYCSMVLEATREDQVSLRNQSQKIPIYDYVTSLNFLKRSDNGIAVYKTEETRGSNLYYRLTSLGIAQCIECQLNPHKIDSGILSICFDTEEEITEEHLAEVKRIAHQILTLLKNN